MEEMIAEVRLNLFPIAISTNWAKHPSINNADRVQPRVYNCLCSCLQGISTRIYKTLCDCTSLLIL